MAPEIPDEVLVDDGILGIQRLCEQGASSCRSVAGLKLHWEDRERLRCPGLPRALCHCQLTTRPARSASMRSSSSRLATEWTAVACLVTMVAMGPAFVRAP